MMRGRGTEREREKELRRMRDGGRPRSELLGGKGVGGKTW
jgi:hypothetical protein